MTSGPKARVALEAVKGERDWFTRRVPARSISKKLEPDFCVEARPGS